MPEQSLLMESGVNGRDGRIAQAPLRRGKPVHMEEEILTINQPKQAAVSWKKLGTSMATGLAGAFNRFCEYKPPSAALHKKQDESGLMALQNIRKQWRFQEAILQSKKAPSHLDTLTEEAIINDTQTGLDAIFPQPITGFFPGEDLRNGQKPTQTPPQGVQLPLPTFEDLVNTSAEEAKDPAIYGVSAPNPAMTSTMTGIGSLTPFQKLARRLSDENYRLTAEDEKAAAAALNIPRPQPEPAPTTSDNLSPANPPLLTVQEAAKWFAPPAAADHIELKPMPDILKDIAPKAIAATPQPPAAPPREVPKVSIPPVQVQSAPLECDNELEFLVQHNRFLSKSITNLAEQYFANKAQEEAAEDQLIY
jgi:hypothetical protein